MFEWRSIFDLEHNLVEQDSAGFYRNLWSIPVHSKIVGLA